MQLHHPSHQAVGVILSSPLEHGLALQLALPRKIWWERDCRISIIRLEEFCSFHFHIFEILLTGMLLEITRKGEIPSQLHEKPCEENWINLAYNPAEPFP